MTSDPAFPGQCDLMSTKLLFWQIQKRQWLMDSEGWLMSRHRSLGPCSPALARVLWPPVSLPKTWNHRDPLYRVWLYCWHKEQEPSLQHILEVRYLRFWKHLKKRRKCHIESSKPCLCWPTDIFCNASCWPAALTTYTTHAGSIPGSAAPCVSIKL